MRGYIPDYELHTVSTLKEALDLMNKEPGVWKPFAGGTDIMVALEADQLSHFKFLNIISIPELRGIHITKNKVTLGSLVTYSKLIENDLVSEEFPLLQKAALETGAAAIQNRGTLGGNIANASPAADTPPVLLAYDAEISLISKEGLRTLPYSEFHLDYKKTQLHKNELIHSITLKRSPESGFHYYRKVGTRKAQAISKVCFAGRVLLNQKRHVEMIRIALGSVGATPLRCHETEAILLGQELQKNTIHQARKTLEKEISPINDIRSSQDYRKTVSGNLLEEFLQNAQHPSRSQASMN